MTIKDLMEQIEQTESLKIMAESYTEIGSMELRKLRKQVDEHRAFFTDLTYIFGLLRYFSRTSHINKVSGNGKTVTILLTSNLRHHNKISNDASQYFMNFTKTNKTDQIVVGRLGVEFLKVKKYSQPFQSLIFKSDLPTLPEMKSLVALSKDYTQILVVFSEFKSVLVQIPTVKDITQRQAVALKAEQVKNFAYTFILEPEIGKMINFFDTQIKNVLLSGNFLEAELARVASRLISMDSAQQNAEEVLVEQKRQLNYAKRNLLNKKILETWVAVKGASQ